MTVPKILAVIPARGGSKGVRRKNVRPLCGKPLIVHTIETALEVKDCFHRVIVSTEDEEIAKISREHGAKVPFMRPHELAQDNVPMVPVLQHAVSTIERQENVVMDWIALLQPTDPLRTSDDIRNSISLANNGDFDSVISVVQVFATHPILMKRIVNDRLIPYCIEEEEGTRRQDYLPPAYMRNGAIYLTRRRVLMHDNSIWGKSICPYIMPEERSVGIDSELDLKLAELLMEQKLGRTFSGH